MKFYTQYPYTCTCAFCCHMDFILPWTSNYTIHLLFGLLSTAEMSSEPNGIQVTLVSYIDNSSGRSEQVHTSTLTAHPLQNTFYSPTCLLIQASLPIQSQSASVHAAYLPRNCNWNGSMYAPPHWCFGIRRLWYTMKVFCVTLFLCIGVIPELSQGQTAPECTYTRGELSTSNALVPYALLSATLVLRDPIQRGLRKKVYSQAYNAIRSEYRWLSYFEPIMNRS